MTEVIMIVAASAKTDVIGLDNKLPWNIREDLAYFKQVTQGHAVIMGRKTYESIGRPLPNRQNYMLSREKHLIPNVHVLHEAVIPEGHEKVFIIGGSEVYKAYESQIQTILLTRVHKEIEGDTFLPFKIQGPNWFIVRAENVRSAAGIPIVFERWERNRRHGCDDRIALQR